MIEPPDSMERSLERIANSLEQFQAAISALKTEMQKVFAKMAERAAKENSK